MIINSCGRPIFPVGSTRKALCTYHQRQHTTLTSEANCTSSCRTVVQLTICSTLCFTDHSSDLLQHQKPAMEVKDTHSHEHGRQDKVHEVTAACNFSQAATRCFSPLLSKGTITNHHSLFFVCLFEQQVVWAARFLLAYKFVTDSEQQQLTYSTYLCSPWGSATLLTICALLHSSTEPSTRARAELRVCRATGGVARQDKVRW